MSDFSYRRGMYICMYAVDVNVHAAMYLFRYLGCDRIDFGLETRHFHLIIVFFRVIIIFRHFGLFLA